VVQSVMLLNFGGKMMIFTVFTLAGIGLCIAGHKGWGIVCFVIVALFGILSLTARKILQE
jgi:hypothetical protein